MAGSWLLIAVALGAVLLFGMAAVLIWLLAGGGGDERKE